MIGLFGCVCALAGYGLGIACAIGWLSPIGGGIAGVSLGALCLVAGAFVDSIVNDEKWMK